MITDKIMSVPFGLDPLHSRAADNQDAVSDNACMARSYVSSMQVGGSSCYVGAPAFESCLTLPVLCQEAMTLQPVQGRHREYMHV